MRKHNHLIAPVGAALGTFVVLAGGLAMALPVGCAIPALNACAQETAAAIQEGSRAVLDTARSATSTVAGSLSGKSGSSIVPRRDASPQAAESRVASTNEKFVAPSGLPRRVASDEVAAASTGLPADAQGPTTRTVRTTVIRTDSSAPVQVAALPSGSSASPEAEANSAPITFDAWWELPPVRVASIDAEVSAAEIQADIEPVQPMPRLERKAAVEDKGDTRTVGGSGVNVRSGASRSSSKLFALTAGQEVTVSENKRGWLRVTDAKGRTGWVYSTFLSAN